MEAMGLLDQLNPQQREAVEHTAGPVLILAGAGSGKTRVITYRMAHLIEDLGVQPDRILAVTFTNKAAAEMGERVQHLVGGRTLAQPWISTFHSFCVRVLRRDIEALRIPAGEEKDGTQRAQSVREGREGAGDASRRMTGRDVRSHASTGYTKDFAIYDESDQQMVVKAAIRRLGIDDKQVKPSAVLSRISWAKNHMMDPQEVYLNSNDPVGERVAQIFEIYRQELRKANALDFDDLLLEAVRLLKVAEPVRERYARRFEYILIDEYQDTNRPQYELMRQLASVHHNVCAVGDEDQSIYSWRGADIRNILEFEKDFGDAKIVRLEQNYRSTQPILEAASAVVSNNVKRKGKTLWTARQGGSKIGYYEAPDGENEALFAADFIKKYLQRAGQEGAENPRAAVLYRTNSQSRLMEEAMRRYQLPYHVVGGFSFYDRSEIKDMISYLKLVQNPMDDIALRRVINTPPRGIGKTTLDTVERLAIETGMPLWNAIREVSDKKLLPTRAVIAMDGFREMIEDARAMLGGEFAERLEGQIHSGDAEARREEGQEEFVDLAAGADEADISFDFGEERADHGRTETRSEEDLDSDTGGIFGEGRDPSSTAAAPPSLEMTRRNSIARLQEQGGSSDEAGGDAGPPTVSVAELLKFLIDRTRYIKQLEQEDTPESLARIENLKELVNAAMDSKDRGETLTDFLDHAALVSDADQYDEKSRITLMTLHAAKGLEFPLVFLVGMEEGLFPHSRTLLAGDDVEEERRLCYVGMTRAMDTLVLSRARYRRRYGSDMPEATVASRFLEEVPPQLFEDVGSPTRRQPVIGESFHEEKRARREHYDESRHYDYESEDQSYRPQASGARKGGPAKGQYNSMENIAEFFASRGKKFSLPKVPVEKPSGKTGFRSGQRVRHPKYGEGTVLKREGDGEDAKITVAFVRGGLKKLVEKYAQLEKV
jgi:DNA helicase II / ATP-dependent DNA helicase PcrA